MKPTSRPITTVYGKPGGWSGGKHGGVDFGTPTGDPVNAMWGGKVIGVRSGSSVSGTTWGSAYGSQVVVDQDRLPNGNPGLWVVYAHLSKVSVKVGDRIKPGQRIGSSGNTGNSTGPHLHVEVQRAKTWRSGNHVNPQPWIDAKESSSMGVKYKHMGKGSALTVTRSYKRLTKTKYKPSTQGMDLILEYLNINQLKFKPGKEMGSLRLRLTRTKDSDHTGYLDIPVHKDLADGKGQILVTHLVMKWKPGETEWSVKAIGGLESARISTNYRSTGTVT